MVVLAIGLMLLLLKQKFEPGPYIARNRDDSPAAFRRDDA
jgi:hypothetical protein